MTDAFDDTYAALGRETDLTRFVVDSLANRFPPDWLVTPTFDPTIGGRRPDALVRITAPDGREGMILIESKMSIAPREVLYALQQLEEYRNEFAFDTRPDVLLVTRYMSPRARELIEGAGASYADATGNVRLLVSNPAVFIEAQGASTNPWRQERETRSLRGRPAARVIRALCDYRGPMTAIELAERAGTSVGSTYRMLDFLEWEALITREGKGLVPGADWKGLIRRWTRDYSLLKSNSATPFVAPRGLPSLLDQLRQGIDIPYAVTGSLAAAVIAPYAEAQLATVFVDDSDLASERLGLRSAPSGANVLLIEPFDEVVYQRSWVQGGVNYAALSQVASDLLTSPGRGPSEGEELLMWMEAHESEWRL